MTQKRLPQAWCFLLVSFLQKTYRKCMRRIVWVAISLCGLIYLSWYFSTQPKKPWSETDDPSFQKAQQCLRENRAEEAFTYLNRLFDERQCVCPETHFQLGQLSLKRDPIASLYHFQQYLQQAPNGLRSKLVLQLIETAKKEFSQSLPLNNRYTETAEFVQVTETLKQIREENARLKTQLAQARFSHTSAREVPGENIAPIHAGEAQQERWYVVQHEDSLSKISSKMYGTAVKWNLIYEANREMLPSANSLKIGMKLRIPAWTQTKRKP